jgi:hypothetical protein
MLNELWQSEETRLRKLRERLQAMTDEELLDYRRSFVQKWCNFQPRPIFTNLNTTPPQ